MWYVMLIQKDSTKFKTLQRAIVGKQAFYPFSIVGFKSKYTTVFIPCVIKNVSTITDSALCVFSDEVINEMKENNITFYQSLHNASNLYSKPCCYWVAPKYLKEPSIYTDEVDNWE
jgi:hypothetical protein